ncbi:putative membrane protein [Mycolicibacterium hassiacum DSM 44199]|uniref:Putative membrane protein n=1 Tax=Mycolicibacterium hassiacum (strain DSM 44199 / CIP 105218 / JCM 12690 / 3849) TaxID=1122247 RepID=K5BJK2_MYCHD|nr:hypothetical protein [Mycolicibacterium hassiacum]EKF23259.1 putative membrane protein [Mycolicibacterium hassiacum DSM 44199]MDA4086478.1 hypothetical protein [Mycolicibacterium hassiacum DSM 44199]VCT89717.1 hypothetical protein MHAS_01414 [Mycolicibacterium hassiacum DSM 44199]
MPTDLLLIAALITAGLGLWIRRSAIKRQWELAPTIATISASSAAYLTSPHSSAHLGPILYKIFGRWNVEDLFGHTLILVWCSIMVYMFLVRFGDSEAVSCIYTLWVIQPLTILYPIILYSFCMAPETRMWVLNFDDINAGGEVVNIGPPGGWLITYWMLILGLSLYLCLCALRVLTKLRTTDASHGRAINAYIAAVTFYVMAIVFMALHIVTTLKLDTLAQASLYMCVMSWAVAAALSWVLRSGRLGQSDREWSRELDDNLS